MIPLFIGGVGTNPPPTSITHFSPSTSSFTHFSRDYSNLWLRTELPMCLRTVRPLYILPLSSRLRTAPFYMFALSTCPCTRALLTNRGHKLGSPFGVEAPSGALESLEGPIILAPTSTPYHLESPLISREQYQQSVSFLHNTEPPSATKPLMPSVAITPKMMSVVHGTTSPKAIFPNRCQGPS
jgi:hypothetical protein